MYSLGLLLENGYIIIVFVNFHAITRPLQWHAVSDTID